MGDMGKSKGFIQVFPQFHQDFCYNKAHLNTKTFPLKVGAV
jgi:hypothetical protein